MSRTWYGLSSPRDAYLGKSFGRFTLVDYTDVHKSSVDYPQRYTFSLINYIETEEYDSQMVQVVLYNIDQLETWCNQQS